MNTVNYKLMNKFMGNCYKKVEGFLNACGKFFLSEEDAWISDAASELQDDYNRYVKNCKLGSSYLDHKPMTYEQAERTIRKALDLVKARNSCC